MRKHLVTFLIALAGGFAGSALHHSPAAEAQPSASGYSIPGPDGRDRVQLGVYPSGGERGLPLLGLFDNRSQLRMLLRLAGPQESPVLICKDRAGRDRLILGLGLNDEEPFLCAVDRQGKKTLVFGKY